MDHLAAQLGIWSTRIDALAARTQRTGTPASFDALIYIDELKALHALATAKLEALRLAPTRERTLLQIEFISACNDLAAALRLRGHLPRRGTSDD